MTETILFWKDKIGFVTAFVGILLMVFTIVWRINPVEGSVIPHFLTDNPTGKVVIGILLVTCMPAWIVSVTLCAWIPLPERPQWLLSCGAMFVVQGVIYFMIGKLISLCVCKLKGKTGKYTG